MAIPVFSGPVTDVTSVKAGTAIAAHDVGALFTGADSYAIDLIPTGLAFSTVTGVLSGTPTEAGSSQLKVTATNTDGDSYTNMFKVPVTPEALGAAHTGAEIHVVTKA